MCRYSLQLFVRRQTQCLPHPVLIDTRHRQDGLFELAHSSVAVEFTIDRFCMPRALVSVARSGALIVSKADSARRPDVLTRPHVAIVLPPEGKDGALSEIARRMPPRRRNDDDGAWPLYALVRRPSRRSLSLGGAHRSRARWVLWLRWRAVWRKEPNLCSLTQRKPREAMVAKAHATPTSVRVRDAQSH